MIQDKRYRLLVIWFGAYQASHLLVNALFFVGAIAFPPPPASGRWHEQLQPFFHAMGASDLVVSALSLVFVVAYLRRRGPVWLGLPTMTASIYAAILFTYGCVANGTWNGQVVEQLILNATYLPVLVLFVWTCLHAASRAVPSSTPTSGR